MPIHNEYTYKHLKLLSFSFFFLCFGPKIARFELRVHFDWINNAGFWDLSLGIVGNIKNKDTFRSGRQELT